MIARLNGVPLLQIDIEPGANVPSVIIDQQRGSYLITNHVIALGHTAICEIRGPMNWHGGIARQRGFQQAMDEHGLQSLASSEGSWTAESGYHAAHQLLQQTEFTAIVAANDQMAFGAISCLFQYGLRVPDDVSVVGFDDLPEAQYFLPPLTTIRQDFSTLGRQGLEHLIEMIEQPDSRTGQHVIEPILIVRDSARPPK